MSLVVTMEAVVAIRALAGHIEELNNTLVSSAGTLLTEYEENKSGLGSHSSSIVALLEDLQRDCSSKKDINLLVKRLRTSADIRQAHIDGSFPISKITRANETQTYIAGVLGRIYASGYRAMRKPSADGTWQSNIFIPDLSYKPTKYNPEDRTFAEIIANLETSYGIQYVGTPFVEGYTDFSQIALAQIGLEDIVKAHCDDFLLFSDQLDYGEILSERNQNFCYADQIAADKQLPMTQFGSMSCILTHRA